MSTVGREQEFSLGMHFDFGSGIVAGETLRKCRNRSQLVKRAATLFIGERGDGGLQFVQYVGEIPVRMKGQVARSGSGVEIGGGWSVGSQGASLCVKAVDE